MVFIFAAILAGTGVGYLLRRREKVIQTMDRALWGVIFLLLFLLGFSVGRNPEVMASLTTLGWYALLMALGSILGSVMLTGLLDRLFHVTE